MAVLYKGQVIYKLTFGYQQQGKIAPITAKTFFPLASVSKPVSAMAIALLVAKGAVDLDQTIPLDGFKPGVTLRDILSHTTGKRFTGNTEIEQGLSRAALCTRLSKHKATCTPGACYFYSNALFSLLAEALVSQNLSFPAAIQNLQAALSTKAIQIIPLNSKREVAYPHGAQKMLPFPRYYPKTVPAAAGVFASLEGMIKLLQLSSGYRPDLIAETTLEQFYKPVARSRDIEGWGLSWQSFWPCPVRDLESYYGLGWRITYLKQQPDKRLIWHSGYIAGIATFIGFIPSEEVGVIIMLNQQSTIALAKGIAFWSEFLRR